MAQIVETYCEDVSNEAVAATPDLITHVEVHKMTVHDGHRLADALDDLSERALTPAVSRNVTLSPSTFATSAVWLLTLRSSARPCRAGISDTNLVVQPPVHDDAPSPTPCRR